MFSRLSLLVSLVTFFDIGAHALSKVRIELHRDNPVGDIAKGVQDALAPGSAAEKQDAKKGAKSETPSKGAAKTAEKKKQVNTIDQMRGQLCSGQADLVGHDDCMKWLVESCETQTFGNGLCKKTK